MISRQFFEVTAACNLCIDFVGFCNIVVIFKTGTKIYKNSCKHFRIVGCTVMIKVAKSQILCNGIQLAVFNIGQNGSWNCNGVNGSVVVLPVHIFASLTDKRGIKRCIMRNKHIVACKFKKCANCLALWRSVFYHSVGNARKLGYLCGNRHTRICKSWKSIGYLSVFNLYGTDFCDFVTICGKTGSFNIKADKCAVKRFFAFARNRFYKVIHKVSLCAVNNLDFFAVFINFIGGFHSVRESLCNTVVCDCNCRVSPIGGSFYKVACRGYCVHLRHIRMQMQFDTLLLRFIHNLNLICSADWPCNKHKLACVAVIFNIALNNYSVTFFQVIENCGVFDCSENFYGCRTRIVGNVDYKNIFISRLCYLFFNIKNIAPYYYSACVGNNCADWLDFTSYRPAVKRFYWGFNNLRQQKLALPHFNFLHCIGISLFLYSFCNSLIARSIVHAFFNLLSFDFFCGIFHCLHIFFALSVNFKRTCIYNVDFKRKFLCNKPFKSLVKTLGI